MKLSEICIERPVFTTVLSLVIVLVGSLALLRLPNRELPDVDPPVVMVTTIFQGASAEVVETSVTEPLEGAINGIEGVRHVTSTSRPEESPSFYFETGCVEIACSFASSRRGLSGRKSMPGEIRGKALAETVASPQRQSLSRPSSTRSIASTN